MTKKSSYRIRIEEVYREILLGDTTEKLEFFIRKLDMITSPDSESIASHTERNQKSTEE